jgi:hypothetical protein
MTVSESQIESTPAMVCVRVMHGDNARDRSMLRTTSADDKLRTAMRESSEARGIAGAIPVMYIGMKINPESPTAECDAVDGSGNSGEPGECATDEDRHAGKFDPCKRA